MDREQTQQIWQVEANGEVIETNFAEMTSWIDRGTLFRADKVRKGNLRWIEAGKVPSLAAVFNAKENGQPLPNPVVTMTKLSPTTIPGTAATNPTNFAPAEPYVADPSPPTANSAEPVCSVHADAPAVFVCGTCTSQFCKACPNSYGGTVKICPFCGALCKPLHEVVAAQVEAAVHSSAISEGFGFGDFGEALSYPFRFKASLVMGAVMFMIFSVAQSIVGFGGIFMLVSGIFCVMLANTLTFGILANTVENFAQGRLGLNFMPSFEEFSLWDDVVHPFFLSIGVYLSSFGPLIALIAVTFFFLAGAGRSEMNGLQSDAARTVDQGLPYAANAAKQSDRVRELLKKASDDQQSRVQAINNGEIPQEANAANAAAVDPEEAKFQQMEQMIQQQRKAQLESAVGKTPETVASERKAMLAQIFSYGPILLLVGGVCLLWGLFYFPAACAVAGYTRSFTATLNPAVGIDTIRRLGVDYVKVLLMCVVIVVISSVIGVALGAIFSPFDMPGLGNLPSKAVGSIFSFYFWIVLSCVIGLALYKASDRLKLPGT